MSAYPACRCDVPVPRIDESAASGRYCDVCGGPIMVVAPTFTLPKKIVTTVAPERLVE